MFYGDSTKGEIEIISPEKVFSNKYMEIYNDKVRFPAGNTGTYIRIKNVNDKSVAVLPVTKDGNIVVIKNYRHGMRGWGVEIPKGGVEKGEAAEAAALRELKEETGYSCEKLVHLCEYSESPAVFSNKIDCFIALGCSPTDMPNIEKTEAIDRCFEITVDKFLQKEYTADFYDALSELVVYRYCANRRDYKL